MQEKYSAHSMLKSNLDADERQVFAIINDTGRHLRAMCRAMQVYSEHTGIWLKNSENDMAEMKAVFEMFYEFVDHQVDGLSELAETIETEFVWFSIEDLRNNEDFRRKKPILRSEEFVSREAYEECCRYHRIDPEPVENNPFNAAFGDRVAPANLPEGVK